ncbi:MAG: hypothetical protein O3A25_05365 [Acidobacteria bacterium]|nr:hypothetical protein [Acidobacteriota bacterium]
MSGVLLAASLLALAVVGVVGTRLMVAALDGQRRDAQVLELLATFGPVVERARTDPRALLTWHPMALSARKTFPEAFEALDGDAAHQFPFGSDLLEAAHAQWTAEWLAWEVDHDTEYRRREALLEASAGEADAADIRPTRDLLEREKLGRYQRQYETYVKVSKALAALLKTPTER